MPKKPNKAGNPQEYIPAGNGDQSGEYADESGSNKHFTSFKKPEDEKTEVGFKGDNLGIEISNDGEQPKTNEIKKKYNGEGKSVLSKELSKRMGKSKNLPKVLDNISNADDELSGVIGDFLQQNDKITIKVGSNLNSKYVETSSFNIFTGNRTYDFTVQVGSDTIYGDNNYSKGGVFFHETGHALDHSFKNEEGHRGLWSKDYVSTKYNKTLTQMMNDELYEKVNDYTTYKRILEDINKEKKEIESSLYTEEDDIKFKEIDSKMKSISDEARKLPEYVENEKFYNEALKKCYKAIEEKNFEEISKYKQEMTLYADKTESVLEEYKNKKGYAELNKDFRNLFDRKYNAKYKAQEIINVKYGDLSDIFEARSYGRLTDMGHGGGSYWNNYHKATETFAEIMSAKATNPESYKLMQKYFPKSLEIFDEIINKVKGVE